MIRDFSTVGLGVGTPNPHMFKDQVYRLLPVLWQALGLKDESVAGGGEFCPGGTHRQVEYQTNPSGDVT